MTREEALEKLSINPYIDSELFIQDKKLLAEYFDMDETEFDRLVDGEKKSIATTLVPI